MFRRLRSRTDAATLGLMLALTFSTGIVDAIGYLGLDRVFAGNMTGNVVILGMALSGVANLPVVGPAIALGAFMLGAVVGGRVLRPVAKGWTTRTTSLLTAVGLLLGVLALVLGLAPEHPEWLALTVTGVLGGTMGLQAATARHLGVKDVTTVVVTSTITGLAADSRLAGGSGQPWFRRAAAIVLIAAGAGVGALALLVGLWLGLAIAAAITLIATLIGDLAVHTRHAPAEKASAAL